MAVTSAMVSSVGASVSQGRIQHQVRATAQPRDRQGPSQDVKAAALQLIQSAMAVSGTPGHDLDVLA